MVEHGPGPVVVHVGPARAGQLEVLDLALVGAHVPGHRDAERAVWVIGHKRRVLQPYPLFQRGQRHPRLPVQEDHTLGRRYDDVLVGAPDLGGDHAPDDLAGNRPAPEHLAVGPVQGVHGPAPVAVVRTFDHLEAPGEAELGQRRAGRRRAIEAGGPHQVALGVEGEQPVGVRSTPPVGTGPDDYAQPAPGEEGPDCRRGLHDLVGVVVAYEPARGAAGAGVAGRREDAQVPALAVLDPLREPGCLVAAFDYLGLVVAVQVGERRGRKAAVRREPGEPSQRGARGGIERVLLLADRGRYYVGAALEVADGEGGDHRRRVAPALVGGRVAHPLQPAPGPVGVESLITAHVGVSGVASTHKDGVVGRGRVEGGHRRRRVDGRTPGAGRPARHGGAVGEEEGVDVAGPVAHYHRREAVQGRDIGRGKGDGATPVREQVGPDLDYAGARGGDGLSGKRSRADGGGHDDGCQHGRGQPPPKSAIFSGKGPTRRLIRGHGLLRTRAASVRSPDEVSQGLAAHAGTPPSSWCRSGIGRQS